MPTLEPEVDIVLRLREVEQQILAHRDRMTKLYAKLCLIIYIGLLVYLYFIA